jgi:hypothetical protein
MHGYCGDRLWVDLEINTFGPQFSGDRGHFRVVFVNAQKPGPGIIRWCGIGPIALFGNRGAVKSSRFREDDRAVFVEVIVTMMVMAVVIMVRVSPEPIIDRRPQKPPILANFATGNLAPIGFLLQGGGREFEIFGEFFEGEDGGIHGRWCDRVALMLIIPL